MGGRMGVRPPRAASLTTEGAVWCLPLPQATWRQELQPKHSLLFTS